MSNHQDRLFGTDGIRGTPGIYPLTDGMLFKIGASAAKLVFRNVKEGGPHKIIIGRDTRTSGQRLETILADAINFYGVDVMLAGTIPTPGLSYLVKDTGADMGIMISASHNKSTDNGIKFFTKGGGKFSVKEERWMEHLILGSLMNISNGKFYKHKGKTSRFSEAGSSYLSFLKSAVEGISLEGLKVVLDCAWGATAQFAGKLFGELGCQVYTIHDVPNGENINVGGAMDPVNLRESVLANSADVGFAFDGDGDRVILVDEKGSVLDGDYIMAIVSFYMLEKNKLAANTLVTTIMSNYGLKQAVEAKGIKVLHTKVGDKYLTEVLNEKKLNLGGEPSGHIILFDHAPTPDGLLTALHVAKIMKDKDTSLSRLSKGIYKLPQILVNVKVKEKKSFDAVPAIKEAIEASEFKLASRGRLSVRYSGTEPLARIMVEGDDNALIEQIAYSLQDIFREELGSI